MEDKDEMAYVVGIAATTLGLVMIGDIIYEHFRWDEFIIGSVLTPFGILALLFPTAVNRGWME